MHQRKEREKALPKENVLKCRAVATLLTAAYLQQNPLQKLRESIFDVISLQSFVIWTVWDC